MIRIEADQEEVRITHDGQTTTRRRTPLDVRPMRIRVGEDRGENCMITLRWDEATESVHVTIGRASKHGDLAWVEVADVGGLGGVYIETRVAGSPKPRITRLRSR